VGDDLAFRAELEGAVAGVGRFAAGKLDLEIPLAAQRDVEGVLGVVQAALFGNAVHRRRLDTQAELHAGRNDGAGVRRCGADAADVLIQQVMELGPPTGIGRGVHVGDVVGNDFHVGLLGQHAGGADGQ